MYYRYFRGVKCLAQGHNTAEVGFEPQTSRSGVRRSTTEPPHSPHRISITSSPKGNDAHLRAIIQSEKKWKHQFFRCLRAVNSVVHGQIWLNFKLIQDLMYVIITCKYEKDHIKNNREKVATPFFFFKL